MVYPNKLAQKNNYRKMQTFALNPTTLLYCCSFVMMLQKPKPLDDQAQQVLRVMMIQTTIKQKAKHSNHTMASVDDSTCSHLIISTLFVFALVRQCSESVSEPDSSLSAKSDLRERSFLRACIKISYEIVLDST